MRLDDLAIDAQDHIALRVKTTSKTPGKTPNPIPEISSFSVVVHVIFKGFLIHAPILHSVVRIKRLTANHRLCDSSFMDTTPKQAAYLSTLERIVDMQIRRRHERLCSMGDARRSIAGLRKMRAMVAAGWNA